MFSHINPASAEDNTLSLHQRLLILASTAVVTLSLAAPFNAIKKALKKADWKASDVELWEINEVFAVVPMIAMQELGLDHDIVNVNGGGCVLGHPIDASGARIMATLSLYGLGKFVRSLEMKILFYGNLVFWTALVVWTILYKISDGFEL